jgi:hypothetical protein
VQGAGQCPREGFHAKLDFLFEEEYEFKKSRIQGRQGFRVKLDFLFKPTLCERHSNILLDSRKEAINMAWAYPGGSFCRPSTGGRKGFN